MADERVPWWRCRRYWLAVFLFIGFAIFKILRANLSIIIVCMVKHGGHPNMSRTLNYSVSGLSNTTDGILISSDEANSCPKKVNTLSADITEGEFEWSKELQGVLLGGFFWGYSCGSQVLGGWLCQRYGSRKVITYGLLPMAVGNLLSPVAVRVSPYLLLVIRVISGASTGALFPSLPVFWSRWAPPDEWSRLLTSSYAGGEFGHAVAFPINGILCNYGGWELPFYVLGAVCLVWCIAWIIFSRDSPSQMPGISKAEKDYIVAAIGERMTEKRKYKTPWGSIFRSRAVLSCACCHMLANYFFYMLLTQGPTYLNEIMNFDITSNGLFFSLPYVVMFIVILSSGAMSDSLVSKGYLSTGAVRKLMNSVGMIVPAIFLLVLAYLPCSDQTAGVSLLTVAVGTFGFCYSGHVVNMADIALIHSGPLAGISNTMASMPGVIAPYVVAYVTKQGTHAEWRTAFLTAIVLNVVGATVFLIFSSGVPQPWALPPELNMTDKLEVSNTFQVQNIELDTRQSGSKNDSSDSHRKENRETEQLIGNREATVIEA